ncbi:hypothetical protein MRX96_012637 [Rhipicephalus microplus]
MTRGKHSVHGVTSSQTSNAAGPASGEVERPFVPDVVHFSVQSMTLVVESCGEVSAASYSRAARTFRQSLRPSYSYFCEGKPFNCWEVSKKKNTEKKWYCTR